MPPPPSDGRAEKNGDSVSIAQPCRTREFTGVRVDGSPLPACIEETAAHASCAERGKQIRACATLLRKRSFREQDSRNTGYCYLGLQYARQAGVCQGVATRLFWERSVSQQNVRFGNKIPETPESWCGRSALLSDHGFDVEHLAVRHQFSGVVTVGPV